MPPPVLTIRPPKPDRRAGTSAGPRKSHRPRRFNRGPNLAKPDPITMPVMPFIPPAAWLLAALLFGAAAHAAPEVPDPQAWSRLSPAEQAERRATLRQQLEASTPEERQAFRSALRERLQRLTPEQRDALVDRTRERWQALPPAQRERLADERRERLRAMSPAERRQMLRERRAVLESLSPEERATLREKLPVR